TPQEPILFNRTIAENIAYGMEDRDFEQIKRAAKLAKIDSFINSLPDKYDTIVGDRGIKLSGGQKQRIAIARNFIKNSPIVIMDESTSALDSITENYIQESLTHIIENKTTLIIAHRLSTLKKLQRILVFDNGKIVEDGSHEALLRKDGLYKKLWDSQVGGFLGSAII
ncbi:MAG: ATP-binding cassette domain-containing protein, partial [Rickettsiaceae bacterium]|nr:ATP-binding cassette domain-containing protein [Rickettsiaceae bacterium]